MDNQCGFKKIPIKIKKLHIDAIIPKYQTKLASGFDIHSIDNGVVFARDQLIIRTGLAFCLPFGWELQIRPRSGLAARYGIGITNSPGTLDTDYLDELKIIMINHSDSDFIITKGDRIAQCVLSPSYQAEFCEVEDFNEEDKNRNRGGGLGSTGIR